MKIIVDRIEEDIAIVETENGDLLKIPAAILGDIKEGEVVQLTVEKVCDNETEDTHSIFESLRNRNKQNTDT